MSSSLPAATNESASTHAHVNHNLTGFIIFLCSESVIFLAFFSGYPEDFSARLAAAWS
jgi:cytochrome c oxidase subunit 3